MLHKNLIESAQQGKGLPNNCHLMNQNYLGWYEFMIRKPSMIRQDYAWIVRLKIFFNSCSELQMEEYSNHFQSNKLNSDIFKRVTYNQYTKEYQVADSQWFPNKSYQTCSGWIIHEIEKTISLKQITQMSNISYQKGLRTIEDLKIDNEEILEQWTKSDINEKKNNISKTYKCYFELITQLAKYMSFKENKSKNKLSEVGTFCEEVLWLSYLQEFKQLQLKYDDNEMKVMIEQKNYLEHCLSTKLENILSFPYYVGKAFIKMISENRKSEILDELIQNEEIEKSEKKKKNQKKKKNRKAKKLQLSKTIQNDTPSTCSQNKLPQSQQNEINHLLSSTKDLSRRSLSECNQQIEKPKQSIQSPHNLTCPISRKSQETSETQNLQLHQEQEQEQQQLQQYDWDEPEFIQNNGGFFRSKTPQKQNTKSHMKRQNKSITIKSKQQEKKQQEQIDQVVIEQAESKLFEKLGKDLQDFTDEILEDFEYKMPYRQLVYNRMEFLVKQFFRDYNVDIRLYGSCATGLALPNSDLDLGIVGFELIQKGQLKILAQYLLQNLQSFQWIKSLKQEFQINSNRPILTSTVIVIKMIVDPTISFEESMTEFPFLSMCLDSLNNKSLTEGSQFNVDLTFLQTNFPIIPSISQNLGQISTEMVLEWMKHFSELQPLVLLFKSMLKKRGLNEQFKGSIEGKLIAQGVQVRLTLFQWWSHSLSTMIGMLGRSIYQMIDFYANRFDPKKLGINYSGYQKEPFFELDESDLPLCIISPISHEILSGTSTFIQTILSDFKIFYEIFEKEKLQFYEKIKFKKRIRNKGKKNQSIEEKNIFWRTLNQFQPLFATFQS